MSQISNVIKKFFEDFERGSNTFEPDLLTTQFSDTFMTADPDGHIQVAKKADFTAGIAKRQELFQAVGFQFVKIIPVEETQLSEHYVMVKAQAHMRFEKTPGQVLDWKDYTTYILHVKDDLPRIVFSLTHGNLLEIMQEHGLLIGK